MNLRNRFLILGAALLVPLGALAAKDVTSPHPEGAYPDAGAPSASPGSYADFIKQVQQKLHEQGFDAGPINGDFGAKTQAALAQFQLSQNLPASGSLDRSTLDALGVEQPPSG